MKKTNQIGLDVAKSKSLAEGLNNLLADYMMFYQNTRGLHWNIKGEKFFELHMKYEELYNDLLVKVDEVAERILTLGATPLHTFDDYKKVAKIKSVSNVSDGSEGVQSILEAFETIILRQRELLALSADAEDEGTNALMSDYISEQEKLVWMYSSFLNK
ncbi:Dps family protein [Cyclobacterium marinum]|uniref:Ferritin Dps family protein n=1 Tax=Cyclobacterium marinum (strain ATCC 25205 / DSM 745 / LMG 13164 / NCIMB 1802) TaxID=880070 RepID=G0J5B3_CYCMS|nr:Dps family protein [Cyclobacterium marinum]AEL27549.1 Ferritin Dps family protein [Cyclobacterium marinum DSM 745]MBI0397320.1 DNA starvation/stationary phase protection protein [Cyclobacterium marinum]MBR9776695.1 DNA starvation/stationary phase protection protein [Cytophagales bacterium]|tara:strand:- start:44463 stop:44939 length:477 start_codon:yes stop_codon:yes gene_type:complete